MPDFHHADLFKKTPKLLNGNLQIIACAGSGKTEFVSERITEEIKNALSLVEISLQEHIFLAGSEYYSFSRNGLL